MDFHGLSLLDHLFRPRDPFGWGHIGHTAGFGSGNGASRRHRVTGKQRQRRASRRAGRKAAR